MRRPHRWLRLFAVFTAVALVASACGDDDDEAGSDEPTETTEAAEDFDGVTISATDYEFDVPDTFEASTVPMQLVNEGNTAHEALFVKIGDQKPEDFIAEFDEFVASDFSGTIPDAFFDGTTSIGDVQPGEDPFQTESTMTEGTWLLLCSLDDSATESGGGEGGGGGDDAPSGRAQEEEAPPEDEGEGEAPKLPPHYELGMWKTIEVTGSTEPEPPAGTTITLEDYSFNGTEALKAGEQTLVAHNTGPDQLHHIVAFDFGKGVSTEEAEEQFKQLAGGEGEGEEGGGGGEEAPSGRAQEEEAPPEGEGGPPGGEPDEAFFTGLLSPGYGQTFTADLKSGHTYLMACFISDREGGPPHAMAHNMIKAFTIK